ncbi:MAG: ABC transporter, partial [Acidimicrobiales bacterium]
MTFTAPLPPAAEAPRPRTTRMPPAFRAYQYNLLSYKRTWRGSLTTTFLYPVLYLAAIGIGLGHMIDHGGQAVDGVPYVHFLA